MAPLILIFDPSPLCFNKDFGKLNIFSHLQYCYFIFIKRIRSSLMFQHSELHRYHGPWTSQRWTDTYSISSEICLGCKPFQDKNLKLRFCLVYTLDMPSNILFNNRYQPVKFRRSINIPELTYNFDLHLYCLTLRYWKMVYLRLIILLYITSILLI